MEEYKMSQMKWNRPPEMQIDTNKTYTVAVDTNKGLIELELYAQHAPKTVNNFVFLSKEGFYDGVSFHRVIPDFVIQGGDPTGTGMGGGVSFPWQMPGRTPMEVNFLLHIPPRHTSMESIPYLVRS
jgi:peptidyl-prolyl cis-trans isomerase B (cyclophilin B)